MKNYLIISILFSVALFLGMTSCERQRDPAIGMVLVNDPKGGNDSIVRLYKLSGKNMSSGSIVGSMVLIPTFDSIYFTPGNDTDTFHSASGFIDENGDTAFITKSFYMDVSEITKSEWMAVMRDSTDSIPRNHPKTRITWFDAVRFCIKRTASAGLTQVYDTTGWDPNTGVGPAVNLFATGYRLPSEDEWEYAAKGGERNLTYGTSTGNIGPLLANYGNVERIDTSKLAFDYSFAFDLFSAKCIARFLPKSISVHSRFSNSSGIKDTVFIGVYDTMSLVRTNVFSQHYRCQIYYDSSVLFDTNTFVSYDSNYVTKDSIIRRTDDNLKFNIVDYYYVYKKKNNSTIDTLAKRVRYRDIVYDSAGREWYFQKDTFGTVIYDSLALKANVNKVFYDTIVSNLSEFSERRIQTQRSFTNKDTMFVEVATVLSRKYFHGYYLSYGFSNVALFQPNSFGLYDMSGNAAEWCHDGFINERRLFRVNYINNVNTSAKIHRGGDATCSDTPKWSSSAKLFTNSRDYANPLVGFTGIGFRCVRRAP